MRLESVRAAGLVVCAIVFLVPLATASSAKARGQSLPPVSDAQRSRLLDRMAGTWRLNPDKSMFFVGTPPSSPSGPSGFIYSKADNNSIRWTTADGSSVQILDGKAYPGNLPNQTVARALIDEFTVDNTIFTNGKPTARNTHFYAPDGKVMVFIARTINERGEENFASVRVYEKVPDGTPVWR